MKIWQYTKNLMIAIIKNIINDQVLIIIFTIVKMIMIFSINPINGGIPAKENIKINISIFVDLFFLCELIFFMLFFIKKKFIIDSIAE